MSRYVFDIETDDYLNVCTTMWIIVFADLDTRKLLSFRGNDPRWIEIYKNAKLLAGHNILGFDIQAIDKLFGIRPNKNCAIHDTLLMSQTQDYKRFGNDGHSLARWGEFFGDPKIEFDDFSHFSQEMLIYCKQDVKLNVKVYEYLLEEFKGILAKAPQFKHYIRAEHAVADWCGRASKNGWPFDVKGGNKLVQILESENEEALNALSSKLGIKSVVKDKVPITNQERVSKNIESLIKVAEHVGYPDIEEAVVTCGELQGEIKFPKWTKKGCYDSHTANWFNIDPWNGFEDRLIDGAYCRVEFNDLSLSSVADVKIFLYRNGWQPTEWNYKFDPETKQKEKTSPKITEDSLEFLGGDGKLYLDYSIASSRLSILKTWLENTDENGMLHGECMTIGTPSMRARHSIIVNVPSVDSKWGKEMRSLFTTKPGWVIIGCDSAGNQARGLAHYLKDEGFIDTLLNGDIHQYDADKLTSVLKSMKIDFEVPRSKAKRFLYAFLFGAGGDKLWSYVFGVFDKTKGNKLKNGFVSAVPGFKDLTTKLEKIYGKTKQYGEGYIPSIAGNRIYVDSLHKLLVYLLQSCEKATCSAAIMVAMDNLEKENIPYMPLIMMHDEMQFMVPIEHAERAKEIGANAFKEGPKLFGIEIMDGEGKIGNNWYETH